MDTYPLFAALAEPEPNAVGLSGPADGVLWFTQWTLAVLLVVGNTALAVPILTGRFDVRRVKAVAALSSRMLVFLGVTHIAGGVGLVLPQATGVLPWLTPVAALALSAQALMASGFHLRAHEEALEPALWGVLFAVVAVGRLDLLGIDASIHGGFLIPTIGVLAVALTVNMVVLLRGPRNPFTNLYPSRTESGIAPRGSPRRCRREVPS